MGQEFQQIVGSEIYDKNLNFLIGSGASYGCFPTLSVAIKDNILGQPHTIETLATRYEHNIHIRTHLFSWYVKEIIKPASEFDVELHKNPWSKQAKVIYNYHSFISKIVRILQKKKDQRRANVFTTNYDGLLAHVSETLLRERCLEFVVNDGSSGFIKRFLDIRNFNRYYRDQGIFDRHSKDVPQINLLQPHGSVYWYREGENIEVSYEIARAKYRLSRVPFHENTDFSSILDDSTKTDADLLKISFSGKAADYEDFWSEYNKLPIVNPTKWKFHETVFDEHYYQILRQMNYEMEKPNTVFIVFGFSFSDEHILNLFRRSLSNPTLKVFVCCFDEIEYLSMRDKFQSFPNVELIHSDNNLDFTAFNDEVFQIIH